MANIALYRQDPKQGQDSAEKQNPSPCIQSAPHPEQGAAFLQKERKDFHYILKPPQNLSNKPSEKNSSKLY
jgi:hypothetical protein